MELNAEERKENKQQKKGYVLFCLIQRSDHRLDFLPPADNKVALLEQLVENLRLVQLLQQLPLQILLGVIDQCQRDRLRHHVDHLPLHNVEVRMDEQF